MNSEEKKQIVEEYIRAYNSFDTEAMLSLFHPECRFENITGSEITASANGLAELREFAEQGKDIFSSRKQTITEIYSENETIVVKIYYLGKLKIDLPNGLKAGDELKLVGRSEFEFENGLIKSLKDYS
jgi:hypothetical protein